MKSLRILICGGGCAGPALAFWLARSGHRAVVLERSATLRASGAQIDIRAQGIQLMKRMGLMDALRANCVDEEGVSFVDSRGNIRGTVRANKSGKGAQTLTSEFEILRGDLVTMLYDATKDNVEYIFGKTVESFEQDEDKVVVHFSDGSRDSFDLLVGADGQGSRIRKAVLPADAPNPYKRLGLHIAYWYIPRVEKDTNFMKSYLSPGGRMVFLRAHSPTEAHVYFMLRDDSPEISSIHSAPPETQKEFWTQRFRDAGWEVPRFLEGMKTTRNWYCHEVVQVRADTWHKGRVVLLGDAAYCPSPVTGMGTTGALTGAYVLAGEISRNAEDLPQAFANYESTMRPFVREMQDISLGFSWFIPDSSWAIALIRFIFSWACWLRVPEILARFSSEEKGGWKLPEYPELDTPRQ